MNGDIKNGAGAPPTDALSAIPELKVEKETKMKKNEKAELEQKNGELLADLQRTRADFENYRKQMDTQKAQAASFAKFETVKKILPLVDDFDRAIRAYPDQLGAVAKNLEKVLGELKLERITSAPGTEFNPELHNAVMMEEGEGATEVVIETLQTGYKYEGEVIRPAMVKVGMQ